MKYLILLLPLIVGCGAPKKPIVHKGDIPMVNMSCKILSTNPLQVDCVCHGPVALAWDAKGQDAVICTKQ
jgi:hypothetical protein